MSLELKLWCACAKNTSKLAKMAGFAARYNEGSLFEDDFLPILAIIDETLWKMKIFSNKPKLSFRKSLVQKHQLFRVHFATRFVFFKVEWPETQRKSIQKLILKNQLILTKLKKLLKYNSTNCSEILC